MSRTKSIAVMIILLGFSGCSTIDETVLPETRAYFHTLYNAVIEESGDGYVVVSYDPALLSGMGSPEVAQNYCNETHTTAYWGKIWFVDHRAYDEYYCR